MQSTRWRIADGLSAASCRAAEMDGSAWAAFEASAASGICAMALLNKWLIALSTSGTTRACGHGRRAVSGGEDLVRRAAGRDAGNSPPALQTTSWWRRI